jgi:hypothetical protein
MREQDSACKLLLGKFALEKKNSCEAESKSLFAILPNFARACGRVSVGRYPDKRPDSRQGMEEPRVA